MKLQAGCRILVPKCLMSTMISSERSLRCAYPQAAKSKTPRRTVEEWRPLPLLCRRFNVPDPFRGQAAPAIDAPRFKTDLLALPETATASQLPLAHLAPGQPASPLNQVRRLWDWMLCTNALVLHKIYWGDMNPRYGICHPGISV